MHILDGVNLKLTRAREHFKSLEDEYKPFLKANPYKVIREFDSNTGENIFRVIEDPVEIPLEYGAIVGDMIYNFRSALDVLANRLVEANRGVLSRGTAFPIFNSPHQWKSSHKDKVAGMSATHVALIKSEQPCFAKNKYRGTFLGYLEEVCNSDKHRNITLVAGATNGGMVSPPFPIDQGKVYIYNGPVEKDTILCRVPGPDMDMYFSYLPDIAFSQAGPAPGTSLTNFYYTIDFITSGIVAACGL